MKKKLAVFLAVMLLLTGCGQTGRAEEPRTEQTQATEIPPAETLPAETQETEAQPAATEAVISEMAEEYLTLYRPVLEMYAQALTEQWEEHQYAAAGLSNGIISKLGYSAAERLGCALLDLDGDGSMELLIGDYEQASVFDAYRLADGAPERLFVAVSTMDESAYLYEDLGFLWDDWSLCREDTGAFYLYHVVQQDWLVSGYFPVRPEQGTLRVTEGYVYNSIVDEFNPWYRVDGYILDCRQGEQVENREEAEMSVYKYECEMVPMNTLENSWLLHDVFQ